MPAPLLGLPFLAGLGTGTATFLVSVLVRFVIIDFIIKALVALGLGIASYTFGNWALDNLFNALKSNLSGAPADALALAELGGFSECLSIIFGAISIRMTIAGINKAKYTFSPS